MRISDWSSDVALPISLRGDRAARQRDREGDILAAAAEPRVREANAPRRDEAGQDFDRRLPIAGHFGDAVGDPRERGLERRRAIFALLDRPVVDYSGPDDPAKIRRTGWRERVGEFVSIQLGADTIEKK